MFTGRPERLLGFNYLGVHSYLLTFCTLNRARLFVAAEAVDLVTGQILRAAAEEKFAILAYCFMPDHVHLLVEGRSDFSDLRTFIKAAKQCSGFHYRRRFGRPLWQRYVYEHVVRDDENIPAIVRYIVENPVRAKLVDRVSDYPFIGPSEVGKDGLLRSLRDHGPA